jgi:hypothetical protein
MAKVTPFKVSKDGFPEMEVSVELPENLEDPRWEQIVSSYPDDVHALAYRAWIVKAQAFARSKLDEDLSEEENLATAQNAVESYVFGARGGGGFQRPKVSAEEAEELEFTEAQLAALRRLVVGVPSAA